MKTTRYDQRSYDDSIRACVRGTCLASGLSLAETHSYGYTRGTTGACASLASKRDFLSLSFVPFSRSLPRKVNAQRSCLPRLIACCRCRLCNIHCFTRKRREEKQKSFYIFFEYSFCDNLVESGKYTKFRHIDFIQSAVLYY